MQKRVKSNICPLCKKGYIVVVHGMWGPSVKQCTRNPKCKFTKEIKYN